MPGAPPDYRVYPTFWGWCRSMFEEANGKLSVKRVILFLSFLLYAFVVVCAVFMPHTLTANMVESIKQGFYISCALVGGPQIAEAITNRFGGEK